MTKPTETVNVRDTANGGEAIAADRREFILGVGFAVLTVQCLPLIAQASGNPPIEGKETGDNLVIESTTGFVPHVHDLLIPYAVLKAPPLEGVEFTTTQALFHRHNLKLSEEQLKTVNQGGTVTEKSSSHLFVIALAKGKDHSQR